MLESSWSDFLNLISGQNLVSPKPENRHKRGFAGKWISIFADFSRSFPKLPNFVAKT